jgi:hypothetical protein
MGKDMKKTSLMVLPFALLGIMSSANASYQVIYGDKQINGDNIHFISKWLSSDPLLGEWVNVGTPTGCSVWTPDPSTKNMGESFQQTGSGCNQEQTRSVQEREQNNVTHEYRNVGSVKNENQTLKNQTTTRTATGTKVVTECNLPNSLWTAGSAGYATITVKFNGTVVYTGGDYASTEKVVGLYKYTKSTLIGNYGSYTTSQVCRTAL